MSAFVSSIDCNRVRRRSSRLGSDVLLSLRSVWCSSERIYHWLDLESHAHLWRISTWSSWCRRLLWHLSPAHTWQTSQSLTTLPSFHYDCHSIFLQASCRYRCPLTALFLLCRQLTICLQLVSIFLCQCLTDYFVAIVLRWKPGMMFSLLE